MLIVVAAVISGLVFGFAFPTWWVVAALAVIGTMVIVIDVSTRDLIGAGHDDRGLVAIAEAVSLGLCLLAASCSVVHRRRGS